MPPGLMERARALSPLFAGLGGANEKNGALCPEVTDAFRDSRFVGMWVPRQLGGAELSPTASLELIEEVSAADGSTGWVLMAAALATGGAGAYLGDACIGEMFPAERLPIMAGQGAPVGRATPIVGGYELSGNWSYGSGVKHADYIHAGALVLDPSGSVRIGPSGNSEWRIFTVPRNKFVFTENWDVIGLRATGSIDYAASGVFVAEDATHLADCTTPKRGGSLYALGLKGLAAIGHTGFALGVGRRVLEEIALVAVSKGGPWGQFRDSESFLEDYGRAEASLRGARALAFDTWRDIEVSLSEEKALTTRQHTMFRLALNHATWTSADVCAFAYRAGGGVSLRSGVINRCFRDMNAGTQHITSAPSILRDCGRELAGLANSKVWGFGGLVERK